MVDKKSSLWTEKFEDQKKKRVFSWHNTLLGPAIIVRVRGTTDTRFYEPTRLSTDPTQALVFTETA